MKNKKVSVIIPFYSRVDWLIEAVESVIKQSYKNLEIIVINDGSKEDLTEFVQKFSDKIIYIYTENSGPASARNKGIGIVSGEYITFLDSDDIWLENKIEKQLDFMIKTKAVWSHTSYFTFQENTHPRTYKKIDTSYFKGNVFPKCLLHCPIATPCVMVKSSYLKENKEVRFSEEMRYGQDSFMWAQLAMKRPLAVIPDELTEVRIRGSNASGRARIQINVKAHFWRYFNKRVELKEEIKKLGYVLGIAFKMCCFADFIIGYFEVKNELRDQSIEKISRILYILPYTLFKLYYILKWKNI